MDFYERKTKMQNDIKEYAAKNKYSRSEILMACMENYAFGSRTINGYIDQCIQAGLFVEENGIIKDAPSIKK